MEQYDFYGEMPTPWYVNNMSELEWNCKVLTWNHISKRALHKGLLFNTTSLCEEIKSLVKEGFEVANVRRHCISGVILRGQSGNKRCFVVGVGLRNPDTKQTAYIDYLLNTEEAEMYDENEVIISDEEMANFCRELDLDMQPRRYDNKSMWLPSSYHNQSYEQ